MERTRDAGRVGNMFAMHPLPNGHARTLLGTPGTLSVRRPIRDVQARRPAVVTRFVTLPDPSGKDRPEYTRTVRVRRDVVHRPLVAPRGENWTLEREATALLRAARPRRARRVRMPRVTRTHTPQPVEPVRVSLLARFERLQTHKAPTIASRLAHALRTLG